ncbi:universal stress protein [Phaeodactylibacter sp.]|uniref:universal stress protein n=1 Tax=Phaeodactylibacter sp. TaxID=1940289 RepID=UPI0025CF6E36|nr:universal stress protein [Phaeodactylibacter sp.]MCI4650452.1 universal stress protein [Phaeodactylibacter sp.]MCI5093834.1 universal stress protein [Phaeodactylibacter sp.]
MKKILFPTDLSAAAERAFIYALHIAKNVEAELITLNVYQKPEVRGGGLPHTLSEFYESYDLDEFENFKDSIPVLRDIQQREGFEALSVQHLLKPGRTVETILQVAKEEGVEMIVMGTTGARGLKEIFMGSVAGEVLENANCPVLAIPEKAVFDGEIDDIAFAVNYQDEEVEAFQKVVEICQPFNAKIHCVNVDLSHAEDYRHEMDQFKDKLVPYENTTFEVIESTDIREGLTKYMETHSVDVLVMVTHKRNFFQELLRYSHAKEMSYHCNMPLLSIPSHILG